jgi:hypothetical protein
MSNFFFSTEYQKDTTIIFDFERISHLCALKMKKPLIKFEETDIEYYTFKNSKINTAQNKIESMINQMKSKQEQRLKEINDERGAVPEGLELPEDLQRELASIKLEEHEKVKHFLLDIGEMVKEYSLVSDISTSFAQLTERWTQLKRDAAVPQTPNPKNNFIFLF